MDPKASGKDIMPTMEDYGRADLERRLSVLIQYFQDRFPDIPARPHPHLFTVSWGRKGGMEELIGHLRWQVEHDIVDLLRAKEYGQVRDALNVVRGALYGGGLVSWEEMQALGVQPEVAA